MEKPECAAIGERRDFQPLLPGPAEAAVPGQTDFAPPAAGGLNRRQPDDRRRGLVLPADRPGNHHQRGAVVWLGGPIDRSAGGNRRDLGRDPPWAEYPGTPLPELAGRTVPPPGATPLHR